MYKTKILAILLAVALLLAALPMGVLAAADPVTATIPSDGSTNVSVGSPIQIGYSSAITSLTASSIQVMANGADYCTGATASTSSGIGMLNIDHSTLPYGTEVTVTVPAGAVEVAGTVAPAFSFRFTTGLPPLNFLYRSVPVGNNNAQLDWHLVAGATGYRVHRSTTEFGGYTQVGTYGPGDSSATVTGLAPGTEYWFRVEALLPAALLPGGGSTMSNALSVLAGSQVLHTNPQDGARNENPTTVSWIEFIQDIQSVQKPGGVTITAGGSPVTVNSISPDSSNPSYLDILHDEPPYGATVTVQLAAGTVKFADGTLNNAYSFSYTTVPAATDAPVILEPVEVGVDWLTISNTPALGATYERYYISESSTGPWRIDYEGVPNYTGIESWIYRGLQPVTTYWFKIEMDTPGGVKTSNIVSATTADPATGVSVYAPVAGATGVAPDAVTGLGFIYPIADADPSAIRFTSSGGAVPFTLRFNYNSGILELIHNPLAYGTAYTITIPAGAVTFSDGTKNTTEISWSFTTADNQNSIIPGPKNPLPESRDRTRDRSTGNSRAGAGGNLGVLDTDKKPVERLDADEVSWSSPRLRITRPGLSPLGVMAVYMDEDPVDREFWIASSGSVVITFKQSYLEDLKPGKHTVRVDFVGGQRVEQVIEIGYDSGDGNDSDRGVGPELTGSVNANFNPGTGR